jgi:hypothetical protein
MARQGRCAHEGCKCSGQGADAVTQFGRVYCSESCAAGTGCGHGGCDCASGATHAR